MKEQAMVLHTRVSRRLGQAMDQAASEQGQDRSGYVRQAIQEKIYRARETEAVVQSLWRVEGEMKELRMLLRQLLESSGSSGKRKSEAKAVTA